MFQRSLPHLVASAMLVAAPALADQLSVTVRATAEEPAPGATMPATLVEPIDVAETPEPICGVCAIVAKTKDDTRSATIVLPSTDAFVGDVDVIVALADGRQVSGRITGVAVDPDSRHSIALTSGRDWQWADARAVWTQRHRSASVRRAPAIVWGEAAAVGANAATTADRGVALAATKAIGGELTLVIVSDPDLETGRPARATATIDGIELASGDELAMTIASAWSLDLDDVRATWIEVRTDASSAAGASTPEYKYIPIRRY